MKKNLSVFLIILISLSTVFTAFAGYTDWFVPTIHMMFRPAENFRSVQNPPGFTWPYIENARYRLIVCADKELKQILYSADGLNANMYTFPQPFEKGRDYYWAVKFIYENGYESPWSDARHFYITGDAEDFTFTLPSDYGKFNEHPVYFTREALENADTKTQAFYSLYLSVEEAMTKPLPRVNINDSEAKKILYYQWAEKAAEAALIYRITKKERYRDYAVKAFENLFDIRFYEFLDWNPDTDLTETRFSYNAAIAYDLLYDVLDENQRKRAVELIEETIRRPYEKFQNGGELNESTYEWPYSSHKYSMHNSMAAALIISGESEFAREVAEFHLPFFACYRDYAGVEDGSGYEGVFYSLAPIEDEISDFLDRMGIMKNHAYNRNKAYDLMYLWPENTVYMIGDGYRTMGRDCNAYLLKAFYYANNAPSDALKSVNKRIFNTESGAETYYSEKGMSSVLHNEWKNVRGLMPRAFPSAKLFLDTGRAAMYSSMADEDGVGLIFVSNPYGSNGHAHPDQNSFVIHGFGKPMAVDSGFYEYYHSDFDLAWSRNSIAHNVITVDGGKGQPYGNIFAKGKITGFLNHTDFDSVGGDAHQAYFDEKDGKRTPFLNRADRDILFIKPGIFIIRDNLESDEERTYEWWLNTYGEMTYDHNSAVSAYEGTGLYAEVVYPEVTSTHYEGFKDAAGNPLSNSKGELIATPEGAKKFNDNRICFRTDWLSKTKMVTVIEAFKDERCEINTASFENYVKLSADGATTYVNLTDGEITADGYTFDGRMLSVRGGSIMLINGKTVKKNDKTLISADKKISAALGNNELSFYAEEESRVFVDYDAKSLVLSVNESIYPEDELSGFGIRREGNEFLLFPGDYHLYANGRLPEGHYYAGFEVKGEGKVETDSDKIALYGDIIKYKITPLKGWYIKEIKYNGEEVTVNSSGIFEAPPLEADSLLTVEFARADGSEMPVVNTLEKLYENNGKTTVTFGEVINLGMNVSEYGIILGKENKSFTLSDADGVSVRKFRALKAGEKGIFGVEIRDFLKKLGNDYYSRAYAVINGREYYGNVIPALINGGYREEKDTSLAWVTVGGEKISFNGENTLWLKKSIPLSSACVAEANNKNASVSIKKTTYKEPGGNTGMTFLISVVSADGSKDEEYTIHCFDGSFVTTVADADLRAEQRFAGSYPLIYMTADGVTSLFSFDISSAEEFEKATFYFTEYQNSDYFSNTLSIYEAEPGEWDENNISYFNAPEKGELITQCITDGNSAYESVSADISGYVKKMQAEGRKIINLIVSAEGLSMICSKENPVTTYRPAIVFFR